MSTPPNSNLTFVNFFVPRFFFERHVQEVEIVQDEQFTLTPQAVISRKNKQFHINIEIEILDKDFTLKMMALGMFTFEDVDEQALLSFMSLNGPAIIFPYIRSFIASQTTLSGFDTITLPTLNLSGQGKRILETLLDLDAE